ncbi:NF-kappa-B inhibitor delta [Marmota monax]|uniref:NF-kappa-B inhibitor delta n=1 Tax=Marmota monax TaxID=9995 RepID=A0A834Q465_MARMO|nr:NF-kappa-B inhibitor delta [Marmota monax]
MEDPLDTRLYAEPSLSQAESWRVSGPPSVPPPLLPSTGPSLETARAHMLALGPQQLLAQDEEGDTLLHLFAAWGLRWAAYAAAEVLQMYGHLDIREHKGKTPLLVAAAANQPLIVEDLLNLGAEPNATDHQGRSVLHVAATYGLPGVLSAVFKSGVQVDLEARDFEGLTPLHTAILALNVAMRPPSLCPRTLSTQARDRLNCVQMLLHMGADHTSQEIKSNKTVLHLAVQAANPTLVQLLLELPRGDLRAFVNMKAHGNTALHMAAALPPGPPQEAIVRHLLAAGADPTLRNLENEQPVHLLRPGPGPERVSAAPDHRGTPSADPVLTLEGDFKSQKMTFNPYPTPTSKCDLQCQYLVLSVHMRPGSDFLSNPDLSTPNLDLNVPFDLSVDPLNSCP